LAVTGFTQDSDEYVKFWPSGSAAKGEFQCSECSYGVIVSKELPQCPMCGGRSWEAAAWSPFRRTEAPLVH
jgi:rubrerythrin